ncbi:MAG: hypothetical protein AAF740_01350 [Bacteroidota bacterium]
MTTYFTHTDYVSNSTLTGFQESERCYPPNKDTKKPKIDPERLKEIFAFGSLLDAMITEPERVEATTRTLYDDTGEILTFDVDTYQHSKRLANSFWDHPLMRPLCDGIQFQKEIYRLNFHGGKARCKFDGLHKRLGIGLEIKGLAVSSMKALLNSIELLDYDRGAAWYMDLAKIDCMLLACIRKDGNGVLPFVIKRNDPVYLSGKIKYLYLLRCYTNWKKRS